MIKLVFKVTNLVLFAKLPSRELMLSSTPSVTAVPEPSGDTEHLERRATSSNWILDAPSALRLGFNISAQTAESWIAFSAVHYHNHLVLHVVASSPRVFQYLLDSFKGSLLLEAEISGLFNWFLYSYFKGSLLWLL